MPYDIVGDTIEQNLKEKVRKLKRYIRKVKQQSSKGKQGAEIPLFQGL